MGSIRLLPSTFLLFALVLSGTIARAQSYGWVDISANVPGDTMFQDLSDLYFISDEEGWITSSSHNEIYHTTDGGQTFTVQTTLLPCGAIWMLNADTGYAGGQSGLVYRTTNGGDTWTFHGTIGNTLTDIAFPPQPADTGYACGYNGTIRRITPAGVSAMSSGMVGNINSITFPVPDEGWACGGNIINHYVNGGWNLDQSYTSGGYNAIHFIDHEMGWAVGDVGDIIHTTDGENWVNQSNPDIEERSLFDVFFLSMDMGWSVGAEGAILRTLNGGALWTLEADGMTSSFLTGVQFTSPTNGFVVGGHKTLLKYTELPTAVAEVVPREALTVAPNPVADVLRWQLAAAEPVREATLLDSQGRVVRRTERPSTPQLDLSGLPPGVYLLRLTLSGRVLQERVVKP